MHGGCVLLDHGLLRMIKQPHTQSPRPPRPAVRKPETLGASIESKRILPIGFLLRQHGILSAVLVHVP